MGENLNEKDLKDIVTSLDKNDGKLNYEERLAIDEKAQMKVFEAISDALGTDKRIEDFFAQLEAKLTLKLRKSCGENIGWKDLGSEYAWKLKPLKDMLKTCQK